MSSNIFNLKINDEAKDKIVRAWQIACDEYDGPAADKPKQDVIVVRAIFSGITKSDNLPKEGGLKKFPKSGNKITRIDTKSHSSFKSRVSAFRQAKDFHDNHYAARYALYVELGVSLDS